MIGAFGAVLIDIDIIRLAIINTVPPDGRTIGNQSLLEQLRLQHSQLTEEDFWSARDSLIEQCVLAKGRGRGGAIRRVDVTSAVSNLAEQALRQVRSRYEQNTDKESSNVQQASPAKPVKAQQATSIEAMEKTLWATADKLRANMDAAASPADAPSWSTSCWMKTTTTTWATMIRKCSTPNWKTATTTAKSMCSGCRE